MNKFVSLGAITLLGAASTLSAATWTGATDASWLTAGNWTGTPPDNTGAQGVTFDASSTANLTQTLNGSYSITGITASSPTAAVVVNNGTGTNTLTLGASGIDMSAATPNLTLGGTAGFGITVGSDQNWNVASGKTLTLGQNGGTVTLTNNLTLNGAGTVAFGGGGSTVLAGAGNITLTSGTLINNLQSGTQTRTGQTTMNGGTISLNSSINIFGSGQLNLNGGIIGSGTGTSRSLANAVSIGGDFQVGGTTGGTTTAVQFTGSADLGGSVRTITSVATGVVTNNGAGAIFSGVLSNGGITKAGSGYVTLINDSNTFNGAVTINAGFFAISQKAISNATSVTLNASGVSLVIGANGAGTHDVNNLSGVSGSIIRSDFSITGTNTARVLNVNQTTDGVYAGTFTEGSGGRTISLVKSGAAKLTLTGAGSRYTGTTTINAGTLVTGSTSAVGTGASSVTVAGGTLQIGDGTVNTVTLGSGASLLVTSGTLKFNAATSAITLAGVGGYTFTNGYTLDLNGAFNAVGTYNLITGGTGAKTDATYSIAGFDTTNFNQAFAGGVLTVTAIPEPSTYGLIGAGALAGIAMVRRRRQVK